MKRKVYGVFTATIVLGLAVAATVGIVERSVGWAIVALLACGLACMGVGSAVVAVSLRGTARSRY